MQDSHPVRRGIGGVVRQGHVQRSVRELNVPHFHNEVVKRAITN
jgi:hypothetical protein